MQRWLRIENSRLKPDVLRTLLLDSQQADGSWQAVYDASFDVDAEPGRRLCRLRQGQRQQLHIGVLRGRLRGLGRSFRRKLGRRHGSRTGSLRTLRHEPHQLRRRAAGNHLPQRRAALGRLVRRPLGRQHPLRHRRGRCRTGASGSPHGGRNDRQSARLLRLEAKFRRRLRRIVAVIRRTRCSPAKARARRRRPPG